MKKTRPQLTVTRYRLLTRPARGYSVEQQRKDARQHVEFNVPTIEFDAAKPVQLEDWFDRARDGEALMAPRLVLIAPPRSTQCPSPARYLSRVLLTVERSGRLLIEVATGKSNRDADWLDYAEQAIRELQAGKRRMSPAVARARGAKANERRSKQSVVAHIRASEHWPMLLSVWKGEGNATERMANVNRMLDKLEMPLLGSFSSCERAFGPKTGKMKRKS